MTSSHKQLTKSRKRSLNTWLNSWNLATPLPKSSYTVLLVDALFVRALVVILGQSTRRIHYRTRIDDRIPVTCCPNREKLQRLRGFAQTASEYDQRVILPSFSNSTECLRMLDRVWLDKRIYRLETELYEGEHYKPDRYHVAELMKIIEKGDNIYTVIMGKASQCSWITQTAPFPWSPRVARENEISYITDNNSHNLRLEYLGTFTAAGSNKNAASTTRGSMKTNGSRSVTSLPRPLSSRPQIGPSVQE